MLFVVTNQAGVASGATPADNLVDIHLKLMNELNKLGVYLTDIYACTAPSGSDDPMRKPNPGMLNLFIEQYDIDKDKSFMVGDSIWDIQAGNRAGVKTILLSRYGLQEIDEPYYYQALGMKDAVRHILNKKNHYGARNEEQFKKGSIKP